MENRIKNINNLTLKIVLVPHFIQLFWVLFNMRLKIGN